MDYLDERIMEGRHAFVYGEEQMRALYFQNLAEKYSFASSTKSPVGVYINDTGLSPCNNAECDKNIINVIHTNYFEILVALKIIDKMLKEVPNLDYIEDDILKFFNYFAVHNKINSLAALKDELLDTKSIITSEYDRYIATNEYQDFSDNLNIFIVNLEFLITSLKKNIPTLERINLLINKESDYSTIYTQVINWYINARSNSYLNIKVGCNNFNDWKTWYDINGNIIESNHDYDTIELVRKK